MQCSNQEDDNSDSGQDTLINTQLQVPVSAEEDAATKRAAKGAAAKKSNEEAWSPFLHLTSTGGAADHQSQALGLYQLSPDSSHGGKPVYKQMHDFNNTRYLWSNSNIWTVSTKVGGGDTWLVAMTTSVHPTTPSWQYRKYGDTYHDDATLTVTGMTQPPPACSVLLSCSYPLPGDMKGPQVVGQYEATGEYSWGRRVFRHTSQDLYLAMGYSYRGWHRYGHGGCWMVRSRVDEGDGYLHSGSAPSYCPAHTGLSTIPVIL